MDEKKLIRNYAVALYEMSTNPVIITQLRVIAEMFEKYHSIAAISGKSTIDDNERREWVKNHLTYFSPEVQKFIQLLDAKGRMNILIKIAKEYETLLYQKNGVERIFITTATPISEEYLIKISQQFEKKVGRTLAVEHIIDKNIIGGVKVKLGSQLYDDSIRTKLNKVTKQLKKGSVNHANETR